MNTTPIIRIEVETMRQAMCHAFSEQMLNIDEMFQTAIEDVCQPEKVQAVLTEAANRYIIQAVEEESKSYFLYGPGRKEIKKMVVDKLDSTEWGS